MSRDLEGFLRRRADLPVEGAAPADLIRGVELYRSPDDAPMEYRRLGMDSCSVVLIWTDAGFR